MVKKILLALSLIALGAYPLTAKGDKFDRGISLTDGPLFLPKGNILFGGTISYQDFGMGEYQFLVLDNIGINAYSLKTTPFFYYAFRDNQAAGARFSYKRSMVKLDNVDLSLSEDLSFSLQDLYNIQQSYYASLAYRYYIPIAKSLRFGLFADFSLNAGLGQGKITMGKGKDMTGTFQNILDVSIDVIPGLVVFMSNEVAIEASVGILGLGYKRIEQTKNQIYSGIFESSSANFKINLLSISLGVNIVLPI